MYKKLISSILIVSILNLVGCYSSKFIPKPDFDKIEKDAPKSIRVITKDAKEYNFSQPNYYFVGDTLYGKEILRLDPEEKPFEGKFSLSEIKYILFQNPDKTYSTVFVSQYLKIEEKSGKPAEIELTDLDGVRYHFMKDDYYIEKDTLYGKGKLLLGAREELVTRKIAFSDIDYIEAESFDLGDTCLLAGGIWLGVGLLVVLIVAIACAASGDCFYH